MERAIAEMEKIKRAEEIYSRRKNLDEDKKSSPKSVYKILFEILFLIDMIVIIFAIQNQKYIFTKEFIDQANSYNINIKKKVEDFFTSHTQNKKEQKVKEENVIDNKENGEKENSEESLGISGESNSVTSALVENDLNINQLTISGEEINNISNMSQEELDINEIKNNYSVILPVNGIKTSGFGERESSNKKVSKNHTGVDIAANQGTIIKSATDGKVTLVSTSGNYGKHIKIQTGDLVLLYAHCYKIYVKEGQEIKQGEEIGEVGSTGNSTGPHLHFELKLHERLVNPEKIIQVLEF